MSLLHAGNAWPGKELYIVTESHDHQQLTEGNIVAVVDDPKQNSWLLRISDMTLHSLTGKSDQYVHLKKVDSSTDKALQGEVGR